MATVGAQRVSRVNYGNAFLGLIIAAALTKWLFGTDVSLAYIPYKCVYVYVPYKSLVRSISTMSYEPGPS